MMFIVRLAEPLDGVVGLVGYTQSICLVMDST